MFQTRKFWPTWLACAALILIHTSVFATEDRAYLEELVAKSRQLRLAERPEWIKLLHYVPNLIAPGVHGQRLAAQDRALERTGGGPDERCSDSSTSQTSKSALVESLRYKLLIGCWD